MRRFARKYWAVLRVGVVLSWIRLLLRMKSLPLVLDCVNPRAIAGAPDPAVMEDLVYYVDRWLALFPYNAKGNCFPRSLTLYRFARRLGYAVMFHCGVRRESSGLDGHAWLTLDGQPFHESGQNWRRFTVTYSYPSDPAHAGTHIPVIRPQGDGTPSC
jgi:hypothetical protein